MLKKPGENSTPLHDKGLGEIRNTRNIPKCNKGKIQQANSQHQTKWRKIQSNPTEIRYKTCCLLSPYLFNTVLEVLVRTKRQQMEIKGIKIGKEEETYTI